MSKHTPGPWAHSRMLIPANVEDRRCGFVVNGPDDQRDGGLAARVCDLRVPVGVSGFCEGEANARLIAAAPDLLAVLRKVRTWTDYARIVGISEGDRELAVKHLGEIDAAIAKAEGDAERPDRPCDPDCARRAHPDAECDCSRSA